jgi:DNA-directed RNA polymerase subunit RPC12/RpoP
MKIFNLKKTTLFDGDQEELFTRDYLIKCPRCSGNIPFKPSSCLTVSGLPEERLSEFLPKLRGIKIIVMGDSKFYKIDDLPLRYSNINCQYCDAKYIGIFGLGEYQPARFILKIVSLVSTK